MNRIGYKYRASLSLSVLGEYSLVTYRDIKEREGREIAFSFLGRIINRKKIKFKTLDFDSNKIIEKIREIDTRIEFTDAQHLASAISDSAACFVTSDNKLLEITQKIEQKLGIEITHPKDL